MTDKKIISKNSTGIQADRDVIVNVGPTYEQVENLTKLFLQENFPKLREDAMKLAHQNVQDFLNEFEKQLKEKFNTINPDKFSDPDVQNSINDAVIETAKRGNKSNLELLVDLIFKRVQNTENDLQSLTASDAIKIIPRLDSGQINYLSIIFLFSHMNLIDCNHLKEYDITCSKLLPIKNNVDRLTPWNIQYLESQGCLVHLIVGHDNIINQLKKKYSSLNDRTETELRLQIEDSSYLKDYIELYEKHRMNFTRLTIIGQLIAAINISNHLPQSVDFENFIK